MSDDVDDGSSQAGRRDLPVMIGPGTGQARVDCPAGLVAHPPGGKDRLIPTFPIATAAKTGLFW
jgi:hypothetical protein